MRFVMHFKGYERVCACGAMLVVALNFPVAAPGPHNIEYVIYNGGGCSQVVCEKATTTTSVALTGVKPMIKY